MEACTPSADSAEDDAENNDASPNFLHSSLSLTFCAVTAIAAAVGHFSCFLTLSLKEFFHL